VLKLSSVLCPLSIPQNSCPAMWSSSTSQLSSCIQAQPKERLQRPSGFQPLKCCVLELSRQ
jgi:hypothetical protein